MLSTNPSNSRSCEHLLNSLKTNCASSIQQTYLSSWLTPSAHRFRHYTPRQIPMPLAHTLPEVLPDRLYSRTLFLLTPSSFSPLLRPCPHSLPLNLQHQHGFLRHYKTASLPFFLRPPINSFSPHNREKVSRRPLPLDFSSSIHQGLYRHREHSEPRHLVRTPWIDTRATPSLLE